MKYFMKVLVAALMLLLLAGQVQGQEQYSPNGEFSFHYFTDTQIVTQFDTVTIAESREVWINDEGHLYFYQGECQIFISTPFDYTADSDYYGFVAFDDHGYRTQLMIIRDDSVTYNYYDRQGACKIVEGFIGQSQTYMNLWRDE